jgi:hypothetical protein
VHVRIFQHLSGCLLLTELRLPEQSLVAALAGAVVALLCLALLRPALRDIKDKIGDACPRPAGKDGRRLAAIKIIDARAGDMQGKGNRLFLPRP